MFILIYRERSEADDLAGPIPLSMWGQPGAQTSLYGQTRVQPSRFFSLDGTATAVSNISDQRFTSALSSAIGNDDLMGASIEMLVKISLVLYLSLLDTLLPPPPPSPPLLRLLHPPLSHRYT